MSLLIREIKILLQHPIYWICMVVMPIFCAVFFTTLMDAGQPMDMPIGVVDLDNTTTTRKLTRMIDGFQSSHVVAHYPSMDEARHAMQKNEIYGFMFFPEDMTQNLISGRQPKMSFYYSSTSITAGALIFKEMKTVCTLASAAVGQSTLLAKGMTAKQAKAFLQPIALDTHMVGNPWINYNVYLSTMLVPACFMLFVFLITAYSLGTEIKFGSFNEWITLANGSFSRAMQAKLLPQTIIFLAVYYLMALYMFGFLHFPHPGGVGRIALLGLLSVVASQGFAVFLFGLIPSLRMSMSISSLWGVLSFSMVGSAFPVMAMSPALQAVAWLFPMRHYYLIYQLCIFNDYPLADAWPHIAALIIFAALPLLVVHRMAKAFREFGYEP